MRTRKVILDWLRDSLVGFLLIVAAFVFAETLVGLFGSRFTPVYAIYLCVGILPFLWFAKKRRVAKGDLCDYLAWTAFIVAISSVATVIGDRLGHWSFAVILGVTAGCFSWSYQSTRRWFTRHGSCGRLKPWR